MKGYKCHGSIFNYIILNDLLLFLVFITEILEKGTNLCPAVPAVRLFCAGKPPHILRRPVCRSLRF